ncbi:hypothetical protein IWQ61_000325 [Dispira simplex]|nr:hypothetical protein IWQ61_000325 [Dispira simplex]
MSHSSGAKAEGRGQSTSHCRIRQEVGYLPISDYGIVGNLRTVALCGLDGSIDFMCYPVFDSPSIFARLLDKDKGGHFSITPTSPVTTKQQYLPNTNVLCTKFLCEEGVVEIGDFMPRPVKNPSGPSLPLLPWLIRRVRCWRGRLSFHVECFPAFNYARSSHTTTITKTDGEEDSKSYQQRTSAGGYSSLTVREALCSDRFSRSGYEDVSFMSRVGKDTVIFDTEEVGLDLRYVSVTREGQCPEIEWKMEDRTDRGMLGPGVTGKLTLEENQEVFFILRDTCKGERDVCLRIQDPQALFTQSTPKFCANDPPLSANLVLFLFEQTVKYWADWIAHSKFIGRWQEQVHRSALTLKLLTYEPTGAIVAAPTFSLPEEIGGSRNWDYRYTWVRDSAFTIYALIRLGLTKEAEAYMNFIEKLFQERNEDGSLQIMYTIHGKKELAEIELDHLDGYCGSRPVRVGNGAADHLQLDIYGELMDAIYLYNKYATPLSYDTWVQVRHMVDYVCLNWDKCDMSIWEVRNQKQNFVYSKVMCWVAIDRGLRLSEKRCFPLPQRDRWLRTRDIIYEEIMVKGWNAELGIFSQSYESTTVVDSSVLIMPLVFFTSPSDPRFLSTINQILKSPEKGGLTTTNLVFRYNHMTSPDGVGGREGSFSMCTFWLVEALTRAGQYNPSLLKHALYLFDNALGYANHLMLFSEEIAQSGEALGNFPQAFTHIALISAAFNLDRFSKKK